MTATLDIPGWAQLLCVNAPWLWVAGLVVKPLRTWVLRTGPLAAVPAILLAIVGTDGVQAPVSALYAGASVGLDPLGRIMLFLTGLVWAASALHAIGYMHGAKRQVLFFGCFWAAMAANLSLTIAADAVTFYTSFAIMSFAAYGLVVHTGTPSARQAGLVYLVLVIVGEAIVFPVLVQGAAAANSILLADIRHGLAAVPHAPVIATLVLLGFGVKAGIMPVHVWLPLAHPAAPTPASAVLSGCMIKAGVLGWLRLLPLGDVAFPLLAIGVGCVGVITSLAALLVGLTQRDAKAVLAYSSISKMGLILLMVALALGVPSLAPAAVLAIGAYVLFHALAKGSLFLGCSVTPHAPRTRFGQQALGAGLLVSALAFAGAPMMAGAIAKGGIKLLLYKAPDIVSHGVAPVLAVLSLLTALLMARFVWLVWPRAGRDAHVPRLTEYTAWGLLLLSTALLPVWLMHLVGAEALMAKAMAPAAWVSAAWPILAALLMTALVLRRGMTLPLQIPPGDLVVVYRAWLRTGALLLPPLVTRWLSRQEPLVLRSRAATGMMAVGRIVVDHLERQYRRWAVSGMCFLLIMVLIMLFCIQ